MIILYQIQNLSLRALGFRDPLYTMTISPDYIVGRYSVQSPRLTWEIVKGGKTIYEFDICTSNKEV